MYRVIIVEDDPMVAAINRQYIDVTPSFRTDRIFKNGSEALSYLKKADADLIILDYYMPSMNGGEFLDALHAAGKAPAVIMVTSANDTDIVKSLLNRGVIDYLVKPFEYTRFRAALDKFSNTSEYLKNARTNLDQAAIDRLLTPPGKLGRIQAQLKQRIKRGDVKAGARLFKGPSKRFLYQRTAGRTDPSFPDHHPAVYELYGRYRRAGQRHRL